VEQELMLDKGEGRTKGIHLSGVIKVMREKSGMNPKPSKPEEDLRVNELSYLYQNTDPLDVRKSGVLMRAVMGLAWEDWLAEQLDVDFHPGELSLDGIVMTPDGIGFDTETGGYLLHEIKLTFKSSKTPVTAKVDWMWQAASYLKGMSAKYNEPCLRCVFHPLYTRGDYSGIDPLYAPQMVEFEQEEVDLIWSEVLRYRDQAIPEE